MAEASQGGGTTMSCALYIGRNDSGALMGSGSTNGP